VRAGNRRDSDARALSIDAGLDEKPTQAHRDPMCGADAAAFQRRKIAAANAKVGAHHQEPVHAMRLGAEKLHAAPFGKTGDQQMRRAADEFDVPLPHRAERVLHGNHHFQRDVEPFPLEKPKLNSCNGREIRIRDQVRDRKLHRERLT
jgi:hypothetical protein